VKTRSMLAPLLSAGTLLLLAIVLPAGCARQTPQTPSAGAVDDARLAGAGSEPGQWFTAGRDRGGSWFSPLETINAGNVARLGFAWEYRLGTKRGLEATPIVVDGVMYTSGNWGRVYALDARTGRERWTFVPPIDGQWGRHACCDVVNRGIAVWRGRVYVGATDGWLYALDAATGRVLWRTDTLQGRERSAPYTVSGTPLIAGDVVVIGNGGADFGVRGYVSAYDLASGKLAWRFFTVPRDPRLGPQDQPELVEAVKTWDPDGRWSEHAGGTVWDGMAYDPALGLVYIGTGNASPYSWKQRSPRGGDNLYLASILALDVRNGRMRWYHQQVPGEAWDYTATAKMILADLDIDGRRRAVLMQAPKNGFFYVLDRATGEVIAAKNHGYVNWTRGLEGNAARPIPNPAADYSDAPKLVYPGMAGAHNWQPMSWSPRTGLVYIPVVDLPMVYVDTAQRRAGLIEGTFTVLGLPPEAYDPAGLAPLLGPLPSLAELARGLPEALRSRGFLRAWDPVRQRVVWERPTFSFWDGGVLSTAGNLVIQGDAAGVLTARAADDGRTLARIDTGTSIMAAPMSYTVDGEQYIAVMAGFGGGGGVAFQPDTAAYQRGNEGRIIVLKLDGGAVPKPALIADTPFPEPPARFGSAAEIDRGELLYTRYCSRCHLFGRGLLPDLRRMAPATHAQFASIVLGGAYRGKGMAGWSDVLSPADTRAVHAFIVAQAWSAYDTGRAPGRK
jgi:quinohemoprotein ethanol dehydrogenase